MSRSNQTETINPCVQWMEWNGEKGMLKYFDKNLGEKGEKVELPFNLTFIVLDQLAVIKGWHDPSNSGIFSNEVKDITKEPLIVKSFNGGPIATGFYKEIKDKIAASGGHFTANVYCAIKIDGELKIASLQFKGAALNAWIEFAKKNRAELYKKAISIVGVEDGTKGRVVFKMPVFKLSDISEQTNESAMKLDEELQEHLKKYLAKNTSEQVETTSRATADFVPDREPEFIPDEAYITPHAAGKIEPNTKVKDDPYRKEVYVDHDLPF